MTDGKRTSQKVARATMWVALNTYLSTGASFVSAVIMARLLSPEHYGIFALALFFLEAVGRAREFGFDSALVHRQKDLSRAFVTHFVLQLVIYSGAFLLSLLSALVLRNFYPQQAVAIFVLLSLLLLATAVSSTQRVFLEKELAFGKTSLVDLLSLLVSIFFGVILAWRGAGVWALVGLKASNIILVSIGLWLVGGWRPRKALFDLQLAKWFIRFGSALWLGGTVTFVLYKYNDWVLGTFLGAVALGFYAKALGFAQMPTSLVTSIVSKVALPTYAKVQNDKQKLERAFNFALAWILRLSAPISLILFLTAKEFTLLLIGKRWLPMTPIFRMLIAYSLIRPVFDDTGAFLTAIGKPKIMAKIIATQALVLAILAPLAVWKKQALGGAFALNLAMLLGIILAYYQVNKVIKVAFAKTFLPTLIILAGSLGSFYLASWQGLFSPRWSPLALFLSKSLFAGGVYLVLTAVFEGRLIKKDLVYLRQLLAKG